MQPSELAKLSIVTLLSYILAKSQKNRDISTGGMIAAGAAVTIYGGLMIRSGMTNTLLLMAISVAMLVIGGAQFRKDRPVVWRLCHHRRHVLPDQAPQR